MRARINLAPIVLWIGILGACYCLGGVKALGIGFIAMAVFQAIL